MRQRPSITIVTEPEERQLHAVSFVAHATRGVIRDQKVRRRTMVVLILAAVALVFAGSTFLQAPLNPSQHPLGFLLFWIVCGWLTLTAFLLAIFDLLMLRLESRRAQRGLRERLEPPG
jgi:ABC-type Co2+ transport system permease subunit